MRSMWIRMKLKSNGIAHITEDKGRIHREEFYVKIEAEITVMHLQDKEQKGLPAATRI